MGMDGKGVQSVHEGEMVLSVTDFRRKYESRVKRVRSASDRVRLVGDLSEDFERLVRSQPYNRNELYMIKMDIERECDRAVDGI